MFFVTWLFLMNLVYFNTFSEWEKEKEKRFLVSILPLEKNRKEFPWWIGIYQNDLSILHQYALHKFSHEFDIVQGKLVMLFTYSSVPNNRPLPFIPNPLLLFLETGNSQKY